MVPEVGGWRKVWHRHMNAGAPWRKGVGSPLGEELPPLTPDLLRGAARSFPRRKGFSGFFARWVLELSDSLLRGGCGFFEACERLGLWPGALRCAILHLIPNNGGRAQAHRHH